MPYNDTNHLLKGTIMATTEPTLVINNYPSAKEQLVSYGLGIAFTAVSAVVVFGSLAIIGVVMEKSEARRAKTSKKEETK